MPDTWLEHAGWKEAMSDVDPLSGAYCKKHDIYLCRHCEDINSMEAENTALREELERVKQQQVRADLDFTLLANLDWVQSAVDAAHDATIQNAWSELKADARTAYSQCSYAKERIQELESALASAQTHAEEYRVLFRDAFAAYGEIRQDRADIRRKLATIVDESIDSLKQREKQLRDVDEAALHYLQGRPNSDGLRRVLEGLEAALAEGESK